MMPNKVLFLDIVHPVLEERLTALGYSCEHDLDSNKLGIENKIASYFG
ncbi:MAG: hydroxyacid dehydrogenase, partial [Flavobacteriales bacterium]|nr:hydroxyacid dehydrogenase [Flavobacteriales bacterium]